MHTHTHTHVAHIALEEGTPGDWIAGLKEIAKVMAVDVFSKTYSTVHTTPQRHGIHGGLIVAMVYFLLLLLSLYS